eukprot:Nk52_evm1s1967 gene=Nk52_evmTU1s1967
MKKEGYNEWCQWLGLDPGNEKDAPYLYLAEVGSSLKPTFPWKREGDGYVNLVTDEVTSTHPMLGLIQSKLQMASGKLDGDFEIPEKPSTEEGCIPTKENYQGTGESALGCSFDNEVDMKMMERLERIEKENLKLKVQLESALLKRDEEVTALQILHAKNLLMLTKKKDEIVNTVTEQNRRQERKYIEILEEMEKKVVSLERQLKTKAAQSFGGGEIGSNNRSFPVHLGSEDGNIQMEVSAEYVNRFIAEKLVSAFPSNRMAQEESLATKQLTTSSNSNSTPPHTSEESLGKANTDALREFKHVDYYPRSRYRSPVSARNPQLGTQFDIWFHERLEVEKELDNQKMFLQNILKENAKFGKHKEKLRKLAPAAKRDGTNRSAESAAVWIGESQEVPSGQKALSETNLSGYERAKARAEDRKTENVSDGEFDKKRVKKRSTEYANGGSELVYPEKRDFISREEFLETKAKLNVILGLDKIRPSVEDSDISTQRLNNLHHLDYTRFYSPISDISSSSSSSF